VLHHSPGPRRSIEQPTPERLMRVLRVSRRLLRGLLSALAIGGFAVAAAAATPPEADANGWVEIAPAGTTCWDGSPWHFWYHAGDPDNVAIWFQGGGACFDAATCDTAGKPTFDAALGDDDYPRATGLFDRSRPDNPLHDFSLVLLPSCTGDVHIGNRRVEYQRRDGSRFAFAHTGQPNTRAALDMLQRQGIAPKLLLVGGESTGAIGAAFWAGAIGDRWPDAQLVVIGDAAGGYRSRAANTLLRHWGALDDLPKLPAFEDPDRVYFETFYIAAGQRHRTARLGEVNHADDVVQRRFMAVLGTPVPELTKPLQCNLNEVRINTPGFHSFIYPGTEHVMLRTSNVYTTRCENQSLVAWLDDLIAGRPVETHWCDGTSTLHTNRAAPPL
jgi:Pectinacetylesterase